MGLDLDAILRAYAVDRMIQLARRQGVHSLMIDFGDEVRCVGHPTGHPAWEVFRAEPGNPDSIWATVSARSFAMATTAGVVRHAAQEGERSEPLVDPKTGMPVNTGCLDAVILASNCTIASALAIAVSVLGPRGGLELLEQFYSAEGAVLTTDGRRETRGFWNYEKAVRSL